MVPPGEESILMTNFLRCTTPYSGKKAYFKKVGLAGIFYSIMRLVLTRPGATNAPAAIAYTADIIRTYRTTPSSLYFVCCVCCVIRFYDSQSEYFFHINVFIGWENLLDGKTGSDRRLIPTMGPCSIPQITANNVIMTVAMPVCPPHSTDIPTLSLRDYLKQ